MSELDILKEIIVTVESLERDLQCADIEKVKAAEESYLQAVKRFYETNENIMAPEQYEAAKTDFEFFLQLLVLAFAYWEDEENKGDKSRNRLH